MILQLSGQIIFPTQHLEFLTEKVSPETTTSTGLHVGIGNNNGNNNVFNGFKNLTFESPPPTNVPVIPVSPVINNRDPIALPIISYYGRDDV